MDEHSEAQKEMPPVQPEAATPSTENSAESGAEKIENAAASAPSEGIGEQLELPKIKAPSIAIEPVRLPGPETFPPASPARPAPTSKPTASGTPVSSLRDHVRQSIAGKTSLRTPDAARLALAAKERLRPRKFAVLAASVAAAAAIGAAVGTLISFGLMQAGIGADGQRDAELRALKTLVTQLAADVGSVKAGVAQSANRLSERLDRLQADSVAKIAKAVEGVERLERRAGVPAAPVASASTAEVTGSTAAAAHAPKAAPKPPILQGWVLRRVYDGFALIEGRRGAIEVEPGDRLPGLGRIEEIKRQDGRWVVVTARGLIVPAR
jgi:hypothetical protein